MKTNKLLPLVLVTGLTAAGLASAGTTGIEGEYEGSYQLTVRSSVEPFVNVIQGQSNVADWSWDFDAGIVTITDNEVSPPSLPWVSYDYYVNTEGSTAGGTDKELDLVDNGDGTYTMSYHFKAEYPILPTPEVDTYALLDITEEADGSLTIITLDADDDGVLGKKFSDLVYPLGEFPMGASPSWVGTAE